MQVNFAVLDGSKEKLRVREATESTSSMFEEYGE